MEGSNNGGVIGGYDATNGNGIELLAKPLTARYGVIMSSLSL